MFDGTNYIICIREHWFNKYEQSLVADLMLKTNDEHSDVPLMHYCRRHTGVAFLWRNDINKYVRALHKEGNKRILVIRVETKWDSLMIINSYLSSWKYHTRTIKIHFPSRGNSWKVYSHQQVIRTGDLNSSFTRGKDFGRDILLKIFLATSMNSSQGVTLIYQRFITTQLKQVNQEYISLWSYKNRIPRLKMSPIKLQRNLTLARMIQL